jgi:hypothetical protein
VKGESVSDDVKDAEEFLETLDKLIMEENYLPKQIFNMDETYSGNGCLKGLSSIRRPRKCHDGQDNFSWGQCCRLQNILLSGIV